MMPGHRYTPEEARIAGKKGNKKSQRERMLALWKDPDYREKMSDMSHRTNLGRPHPWQQGVPRSEETKKKISAATKGNKRCAGKKNSLGHTYSHTTEAKERIRKGQRAAWEKNPKRRIAKTRLYSWGGCQYRSTYEVEVAKRMSAKGIRFEYEPERFNLGETTYLPDFYLPDLNIWIEVKGWMNQISAKKIELFRATGRAMIVLCGQQYLEDFEKKVSCLALV